MPVPKDRASAEVRPDNLILNSTGRAEATATKERTHMNTTIKTMSALVLLAVATLMPACDIKANCDPRVEICLDPGQAHPSTLDEKRPTISVANAND